MNKIKGICNLSEKKISELPDKKRWMMLTILLVGAFLPPLDFFIVNLALPSIHNDLQTSSSMTQLIISVYAGIYAAALITGGRLGDIFGRGRVFLLGALGFAISSAICGFSTSVKMLIFGRALQGLTAAITAPQGLALIQAIFPEHEKPRALGIYGSVFGLAAVIGQILGGFLMDINPLGLGWRVIFFINIPIVALVLFFGAAFLKKETNKTGARIDWPGVILSSGSLILLLFALTLGRENGWPWWCWVMIFTSVILARLFWNVEKKLAYREREPLVFPDIIMKRNVRNGLLSILLFYTISPFFLLLSIYLQDVVKQNSFWAGVTFFPFGIGFLLGPLTTTRLLKLFNKEVSSIGISLEIIGFLIILVAIITSPGKAIGIPYLSAALFLIGFGQGIALPTLVRTVILQVNPQYSGMISGVVNSTLQISASLGVAVIGGVYFSAVGPSPTIDNISISFFLALLFIVINLSLAALIAHFVNHQKQRRIISK